MPLYLLLAYAKAQASDLTADEKRAVAGFAATIKGAAKYWSERWERLSDKS